MQILWRRKDVFFIVQVLTISMTICFNDDFIYKFTSKIIKDLSLRKFENFKPELPIKGNTGRWIPEEIQGTSTGSYN